MVLREGPGPTAMSPDFRNDRNGRILATERFGMQGRKMEVRKRGRETSSRIQEVSSGSGKIQVVVLGWRLGTLAGLNSQT